MKTFDLINKQNTTGMSLAQRANMELSDPVVNNNMNNVQNFSSKVPVNTFSNNVSQSGLGIYGSQDQRQQSVGYPLYNTTPLLQTVENEKNIATAADSSFVKANHPTFTGGYFNKSQDEINASVKNSPDLPKNIRKDVNETIIQASKINQNEAVKIAKNKNIDTKYWAAKNKGIQL